MKISLVLHFWAPMGLTDDEAADDIRRQAQEWAAQEPNVLRIEVSTVDRPYRDRPHWWEASCELQLSAVEQPTLWEVA